MNIASNVAHVLENMSKSCERCNRDLDDVTLVSVSKKKTSLDILEAYNAGCIVFGENYVQEAHTKFLDEIDSDIRTNLELHLIGPLQSNKVKIAAHLFDTIQSLSRIKIARSLHKELTTLSNKHLECLVQVDISGDKHGVHPDELAHFIEQMYEFDTLTVKGLMMIGSNTSNIDTKVSEFRKLRKLRDSLEDQFSITLPELSMGMSEDYHIAIEEGATIVRVGSAIFGSRN